VDERSPELDPAIQTYYDRGLEQERLTAGGESLELVRTRELLHRFLPPTPARVLDVGGGAGIYAAWLAAQGYDVHLIDPVPLHMEQARLAAQGESRPFTAALGDARHLDQLDACCEVVLLLGPLYHLTEAEDRLQALREAHRVLRPGGLLAAAGISRFASLLDGARMGALADPDFAAIVERDLREGQHRNPHLTRRPGWFTTAYFHHPSELAAEVTTAGFALEGMFGIEGPGWLFEDHWHDPAQQPALLNAARAVETEPTLLGLSPHLLAVGRRSS
jgi:SAM-dependent methyltransferase